MISHDWMPNLPNNTYITELEYALGLHRAAGEAMLFRNRTDDKGFAPGVAEQRRQLLDIISQMLINERDKTLDLFCTSWIKYRNLSQP